MRRTLTLTFVADVVFHDGAEAMSDKRLAHEFGTMCHQVIPRVLGIGCTSVVVPDGAGGFVKKPAVVVSLRTMEAEVAPIEGVTTPSGATLLVGDPSDARDTTPLKTPG